MVSQDKAFPGVAPKARLYSSAVGSMRKNGLDFYLDFYLCVFFIITMQTTKPWVQCGVGL
jgi:hypothetical protein